MSKLKLICDILKDWPSIVAGFLGLAVIVWSIWKQLDWLTVLLIFETTIILGFLIKVFKDRRIRRYKRLADLDKDPAIRKLYEKYADRPDAHLDETELNAFNKWLVKVNKTLNGTSYYNLLHSLEEKYKKLPLNSARLFKRYSDEVSRISYKMYEEETRKRLNLNK